MPDGGYSSSLESTDSSCHASQRADGGNLSAESLALMAARGKCKGSGSGEQPNEQPNEQPGDATSRAKAHAKATTEQDSDKGWWLVANGLSEHFAPAKDYNQKSWNQVNTGVGAEYHFNRNSAIAFGEMDNSLHRTSAYATYDWTPVHIELPHHSASLNFGLMAGAVTGYPVFDGGPIPLALPLATVETKHFGVNTLLIPPLGKATPAVLGAQFKFHF